MDDSMKHPPEESGGGADTAAVSTPPEDADTTVNTPPEDADTAAAPQTTEEPIEGERDDNDGFFDYSGDMGTLAPPSDEQTDPNAGKNLALTSMILSIVALCWCGSLGLPVAIVAIVLAGVARKRARHWAAPSVSGLVIGIIGVLYSLLAIALIVFILLADGMYTEEPYIYSDYTGGVLPQIFGFISLK